YISLFFFSSRRRHTRFSRDWSSDVCSSDLAEKLVAAVADLQVGDGLKPGVTLGPLIDEPAVRKVQEHVEDAVSKGARLLVGGKPHELGHVFFQPTVLADVTPEMKVAWEETFGPLAPLLRFGSDEEMIA